MRVEPLEPEWKDVLDRVIRSLGYSMNDVARLAPRVAELSRAYNEGSAEGKKTKLPLEARIAFSFPRDVPKGAAAVRELIAEGILSAAREVVMNEPSGDFTRIRFLREQREVKFPPRTFDQTKPLELADIRAAVGHAP